MAHRSLYIYELGEVQRALLQLSEAVQHAIRQAMRALLRSDIAAARRIIQADDDIDERCADVEERALRIIASQQPRATDLRFLLSAIRIADELERMGDYAEGIAALTVRDESLPMVAPPSELQSLTEQVTVMLQRSVAAFIERDAIVASQLERDDDQIDALNQSIQNAMLYHVQTTPETAERAIHILFVGHNLERIADRAVNIAERAAFISTGKQSQTRRWNRE
jgi:phosphate transport system protein